MENSKMGKKIFLLSRSKTTCWGFPGSPVVRNLPANAGDMGLVPWFGTKLPQALGQLRFQQLKPGQHVSPKPSFSSLWIVFFPLVLIAGFHQIGLCRVGCHLTAHSLHARHPSPHPPCSVTVESCAYTIQGFKRNVSNGSRVWLTVRSSQDDRPRPSFIKSELLGPTC